VLPMPSPFDPDLASKLLSKAGVKVTCTWINWHPHIPPNPVPSSPSHHAYPFFVIVVVFLAFLILSNLGNYLQNRKQLFAPKQSEEKKKTENAHVPRVQFVDRNQSMLHVLAFSPASPVWITLWSFLQVSPSELAARASPTAPR
jgi:hypothetical protein